MHIRHIQTDVVMQRADIQVGQRSNNSVLFAEDVAFNLQCIIDNHRLSCGIVIFRPYLTR